VIHKHFYPLFLDFPSLYSFLFNNKSWKLSIIFLGIIFYILNLIIYFISNDGYTYRKTENWLKFNQIQIKIKCFVMENSKISILLNNEHIYDRENCIMNFSQIIYKF